MVKTRLGALRYNNRMEKIFDNARRIEHERNELIANHVESTDQELQAVLEASGYCPETAAYYVRQDRPEKGNDQ
jgi:hypothetical protein